MRASENRNEVPGSAKLFDWTQIHVRGKERPQSFSM